MPSSRPFGLLLVSTLLAACGPSLDRITIAPADPSIAVGLHEQLRATGFYSDGTSTDLTATALWSSSDVARASVTGGLVEAISPGLLRVTATQDGASAFVQVTILPPRATAIAVDPGSATVALGLERTFRATAELSNGTTADIAAEATWASSDESKAKSLGGGKFLGVGLGTVTVTATKDGATTPAVLEVTAAQLERLELEPRTAELAVGMTQGFQATGVFSDATTQVVTGQVTWSSSAPAVATLGPVDEDRRVVTAKSVGVTTISARLGAIDASATVTVTPAQLVKLELSPSGAELPVGENRQFLATATFSDGTHRPATSDVSWRSSDPGVATVGADTEPGLVRAVGVGEAEIRIEGEGGIEAKVMVRVTPARPVSLAISSTANTLPKGATLALGATATYSDGTDRVVSEDAFWKSSATSVATVSNLAGEKGLVKAAAVGSATISADFGGQQATFSLTVTPAELVGLELAPAATTLYAGLSRALLATGVYSDGTRLALADATFTSSSDEIATVSNAPETRGLVTAVAPGEATITASSGELEGQASITVSPAAFARLEITPATASMAIGARQQFEATARYEDDGHEDVTALATWTIDDDTKAEISNAAGTSGLATSRAEGSTIVKATWGGKEGTAELTVRPAEIASLAITPSTAQVTVNGTQAFTVEATLTDGTKRDVTSEVTWSSGAETIATIAATGVATAKAIGNATISARSGEISATATLQVIAKALVSIAVTPTTPSLADGRTLQMTATATYNDGSTAVVTDQASWSSSSTTRASVTNSGTTGRGLVTAKATGTVTISAGFSGKSASTTLTVTAAEIDRITVTPATATLKPGATQALVASAKKSDGSSQTVTTSTTWTTSDAGVATVSASGLVTAIGPGTATIKGVKDGHEATMTITVLKIDALAVAPASVVLATGMTKALAATATWSDGSTETVTASVTWTSDATGVATVSPQGVVSAVGPGAAQVKAAIGGKEASLAVSVPALALLEVLPATKTIKRNEPLQLTANGLFDDADLTIFDLTALATWTSSSEAIATVSATGLVRGVAAGTVTITAAREGETASAQITVTDEVFGCDLLPKINEVQIGTSSSSVAEFVEIYNPCPAGSEPFSLDGYKLLYKSEFGTAVITAYDFANSPATLAPGAFLVIAGTHSSMAAFPRKLAQTLSGSGGGLQLRGPDQTSGTAADSLRYGTNATNDFVRGTAAPAPADAAAPGRSLVRIPDGAQVGATPNNSVDFKVSSKATPGAPNKLN